VSSLTDLADENHGEAGEEGVEEAQLRLLLGPRGAVVGFPRRVDEHLRCGRTGGGCLGVRDQQEPNPPRGKRRGRGMSCRVSSPWCGGRGGLLRCRRRHRPRPGETEGKTKGRVTGEVDGLANRGLRAEEGGALTWSPAAEATRGAETARARRSRVKARPAIGSAERGDQLREGGGR
jgi:hypothetical protein